MSSIKNPNHEAENPAPMPQSRTSKPKMAVQADLPPGIELDGHAHVIPLAQRTAEDRQKTLDARKTDNNKGG